MQALARRLPVHVAALPVGGGVCVTMHFSFFQVRTLTLTLTLILTMHFSFFQVRVSVRVRVSSPEP